MTTIVDGSLILPNVWLGNIATVKHYRGLIDHGFTHVISALSYEELSRYKIMMPDELVWYIIPADFYSYFDKVAAIIDDVTDGKVMIHCADGFSIGPVLVIAYIMWKFRICTADAIAYFARQYSMGNNLSADSHNALMEYEAKLFWRA
jgi:protein-tyrosine phosphatase